jgi:SNF2 family DNA or RNA helicase
MINYDLPWNPNKLEQRMGRIHRIAQDRNVYYYNFVINGTIDGYIIRRLLDKIENIKNAIGEKYTLDSKSSDFQISIKAGCFDLLLWNWQDTIM